MNLRSYLSTEKKWVWQTAVVVILWLAFLLRLHTLAFKALWFDEAIEYWVASVPFEDVLMSSSRATHDPPLYSYVLNIWMQAGISEFWLRFPSLLFSIIGIAGVMGLGRQALGCEVALVAGLLLTFAAADIRYAQEVGQYSLMVALLAWNFFFLHLAWSKNRWKWWLLWGATALVSIYCHYGSAIAILATTVVVWSWNMARHYWTAVFRHTLCGILMLLLLLPLIFIIIPEQLGRLGAVTSPIHLYNFLLTSKDILLFHFMGNQTAGWPWPVTPSWLVWLPILLCLLIPLVKAKSPVEWPVLLWVTWLVYYLVSRPGIYFFLGTRHALLLSPFIMVTAATGIIILWRWHQASGAFLLLVFIATSISAPLELPEELRPSFHYWLTHRQPTETTYIYYGTIPGFRYLLDLADATGEMELPHRRIDCSKGLRTSFCVENNLFYGTWIRLLTPDEKRESILETLGSTPDRLWILFSHVHQNEERDILAVLEQEYKVVLDDQNFTTSAYLLQKRP